MSIPADTVWTPAAIEALKSDWAAGQSAGVIAAKLGLSRSAVIGKVHRLGLNSRQTTESRPHPKLRGPRRPIALRPKGDQGGGAVHSINSRLNGKGHRHGGDNGSGVVIKVRERVAHGPVEVDEAPIAPVLAADFNGVTLFDLEAGNCRWPIGEPSTPSFFFCGAPGADLKERRPYCGGTICNRFMTTTGEAWR